MVPSTLGIGAHTLAVAEKAGPWDLSPSVNLTVVPEPQAPTVSYVGPKTASVGDTIYVYGTNYNQNTFVYLNGDYGPVVTTKYISPTSLSFVIPSNASVGTHSVFVNEKGSSFPTGSPVSLSIIATPQAPVISYISPSSATAGTTVHVYGYNFNQYTFAFLGGNYGPTLTTTYISPTAIRFVIPSNVSVGIHKLFVNEKRRLQTLSPRKRVM